ncbi:hypothetical protein [Listeria booriae]|uniref:Uncharacterized protein n=1 Tax=Listeria booriae TaxID=1552123 RepID=A0A841XZK4_9LIST|nr:hypothetical protein [Listeria booriae]MBC1316627.1 hypothetical protein [Listeria booriae]
MTEDNVTKFAHKKRLEIGGGTRHGKPYRSGYMRAMDDVIEFQDDSRASGLNESQKMMLWHMRDSYVAIRKKSEFICINTKNGFTVSIYLILESLIKSDGKLYRLYRNFSEKEQVQIIQVFMDWALEQEDAE